MNRLDVAEEFGAELGARVYDDGDLSGQEFRERFLIPRLERAIQAGSVLCVDFSGVEGMPTSFLEEAFGGTLRARPDWPLKTVLAHLEIRAGKRRDLWPFVQLASAYLVNAEKRRAKLA